MWLAGDTKGLLVVLQPAGWVRGLGWWLNFVVSTALFVYVSYWLSQSTGELTSYLCAKAQPPSANGRQHNASENNQDGVPLLPTNMTAEEQLDNEEDTIQRLHKRGILESIGFLWKDLRFRSIAILLFLAIVNQFS
jgi:hypothetical protein